jgi:hypothetical protein
MTVDFGSADDLATEAAETAQTAKEERPLRFPNAGPGSRAGCSPTTGATPPPAAGTPSGGGTRESAPSWKPCGNPGSKSGGPMP